MKAIKEEHPLMRGDMRGIESWREWLKLWDSTPLADVRHGLLHVGLTVPLKYQHYEHSDTPPASSFIPSETMTERILFYLAVANGWTDADNFQDRSCYRRSTGRSGRVRNFAEVPEARQRQRLASKAFIMLFGADGPLAPSEKERRGWNADNTRHWWSLESREVISILDFFRPKLANSFRGQLGITNLPGRLTEPVGDVRPNHVEVATRFLIEFTIYLWRGGMDETFSATDCESYRYKARSQSCYLRENPSPQEVQEVEERRRFNEQEELFEESLKRRRFRFALTLFALGAEDRIRSEKLELDDKTIRALRRFAMQGRVEQDFFEDGKIVKKERRPCSLKEAFARGSESRRSIASFVLLHDARRIGKRQQARANRPAQAALEAVRAAQAAAERDRRARELEAEARNLRRVTS